MKRQTAMALAAVFAMSVAGTALAAPANPFVDVPAKHWAYDSLNKLAQAGVISGYGDGTYKGDKTLTRYEVATIVAKAMANSDKADAATQKEIEALKAEFGTELNNLGVRVDNLEKNASKVKFTGEIRERYDVQDKDGGDTFDRTTEKTRFRLNMEAPIDDKSVVFHGRYESNSAWGSGSDNEARMTQAYITGKAGGLGYSFGRMPLWLGYGLIADVSGNLEGITLSGGNQVKVTVGAVKTNSKTAPYRTGATLNGKAINADTNLAFANIDANINKNLNMVATYLADEDDDIYKTTTAGLKYKGIKNFTIFGEYGENDSDYANQQNNGDAAKGWYSQIKYRGAQKNVVGSSGIWVSYRSAEDGFDPSGLTTWDSGRTSKDTSYNNMDNVKGLDYGFEYTVFKNGIMTLQYNDLELKDPTASQKKDKESLMAYLKYWF